MSSNSTEVIALKFVGPNGPRRYQVFSYRSSGYPPGYTAILARDSPWRSWKRQHHSSDSDRVHLLLFAR